MKKSKLDISYDLLSKSFYSFFQNIKEQNFEIAAAIRDSIKKHLKKVMK